MCSESRTPGHTKHRQTLYLNPTVVLADCPGLVYPAVDIPKQLQVLCGIFPIAQIREPYSCVQFIAEHIPLEEIYALKNPEDGQWSAWGICDAYAEKRGYLTKSGKTNPYRAGLEILNDVIDGRIQWHFDPETTQINLNVYSAPGTEEKISANLSEESGDGLEDLTDQKPPDQPKKLVPTPKHRPAQISSDSTETSSEDDGEGFQSSNPFTLLK